MGRWILRDLFPGGQETSSHQRKGYWTKLVLHSCNEPQAKQLPPPPRDPCAPARSRRELAGEHHGPSCGTHAPQPAPSLPRVRGAQPASGTTNAPAPAAPGAGGVPRHHMPAPGNNCKRSQPGEGCRAGGTNRRCPQGTPPPQLGALLGLRELKRSVRARVGPAAPGSLPQLVPCPCRAEPCVDVSVLAIKVLNKERGLLTVTVVQGGLCPPPGTV